MVKKPCYRVRVRQAFIPRHTTEAYKEESSWSATNPLGPCKSVVRVPGNASGFELCLGNIGPFWIEVMSGAHRPWMKVLSRLPNTPAPTLKRTVKLGWCRRSPTYQPHTRPWGAALKRKPWVGNRYRQKSTHEAPCRFAASG